MDNWKKQPWFIELCNKLRKEREAAQELAADDNSICPKLDALLRGQGIKFNEPIETDRQLLIAVAEGIACKTIQNQDCSEFGQIFGLLPSLQQIRSILLSPEVNSHVKISPDPCRIKDGRIPPHLFWEQLRQQVFDGCDKD